MEEDRFTCVLLRDHECSIMSIPTNTTRVSILVQFFNDIFLDVDALVYFKRLNVTWEPTEV